MKTKWFACLVLLFAVNAFSQGNFVYTNDNFTPNTVSAFKVNSDGSLTLLEDSPYLTGGNGGGSDIDAGKITTATAGKKSFLYAANVADATIAAFVINPQGHLIAVAGSPFIAGTPNSFANFSLAASPDGQFLFVTDDTTTVVHVFTIAGQSGALTEVAGSPFNLGASAEGLKVTPNGQFLLAGLKSIDAVGVFAIGSGGTLSPAPGSPFLANGPAVAVAASCGSSRVFASSAGSNMIDVYNMAADGSLTPVAGSPFPTGGSSTVNALALSPDNAELFTPNVFNSTVSSLAVGTDGSLSPVPGSPFPADDWVGAIAATRSGNFVYGSLFAVGKVDGWHIGPDGGLTPVPGHPFPTGQAAAGVQALTTFPLPVCAAP